MIVIIWFAIRVIHRKKASGSVIWLFPSKMAVSFMRSKFPLRDWDSGCNRRGVYHYAGILSYVPGSDKWILVNTSSDTIFHYLPDGNLSPFIVRSPSISSMDTKVFLFPTVITDRYCFMRTMRKEVDFTTFKGFLGEDLVYDKQENALFSYILYNDDFINKEEVSLTSEPRNPEIAICQTLDAPDLVEAYEKGQLKGKLKEIAANLDEESNPVAMLLKKKK